MARKTKKQIEAEKEAKDVKALKVDVTKPEPEVVETNATMELVELSMKSEENSSTKWRKLGDILFSNSDLFDGSNDPDGLGKKECHSRFIGVLNEEVLVSELPEEVLDRKGDKMTLLKKNGTVKWSSWAVTARVVQHVSDVWKVVELGLPFGELFSEGIIMSRYELLKKIEELTPEKTPETAIETILRCNELVGKKVKELEEKDIETAISSIVIIQNLLADMQELFSKS